MDIGKDKKTGPEGPVIIPFFIICVYTDNMIIFNDKNDLSHFSDHEQNRIIEYILLEQQKRFDLQESYVEKWHKHLDKAVIT